MSVFKFKIKSKIEITGLEIFNTWNIEPLHQINNVVSIDYKEYFVNNQYKHYAEVGFRDGSLCEYAWIWKPEGGGYWGFRYTIRRSS